MNPRQLGPAADLWQRWVLLAAGHAALSRPGCEIHRSDGQASLGDADGWLRMRWLGGHRAVLWGGHPGLEGGAALHEALLDEAPDWAYDADRPFTTEEFGFLAWYAQHRWWSVPDRLPTLLADLITPACSDDGVLAWWQAAWPDVDADVLAGLRTGGPADFLADDALARMTRQLDLGASWEQAPLSTSATAHLRDQIHAQMRGEAEIADRALPPRPTLLRQWARVHTTGLPFTFAVCGLASSSGSAPGLVVGAGSRGLSEPAARALTNVLMELRMAETHRASGAWLYARVLGEGRSARLERAFDTWPAWYAAPGGTLSGGPSLAALLSEMEQRAPQWRPGWASLLPH